MKIIMGMATISTSEITVDSFLLSPLMAPQVAMAADTPQIETAEASMVDISESIFIFLAIQKAMYQTEITTSSAWISPKEPAFIMLVKSTEVPSSTSPILM